jgi:hypothetical protein
MDDVVITVDVVGAWTWRHRLATSTSVAHVHVSCKQPPMINVDHELSF